VIIFAVVLAAFATWLLIPQPSLARLTQINAGISHPASFINAIMSTYWQLVGASTAINQLRNNTIAAISALAADLRAGSSPSTAIANSGGEPCVWPHVVAAAQHHIDITAAIEQDARHNPDLRYLAVCWRVGMYSGSGLAASVTRLAQSMREAQEVRIQLQAELATPRATARMLSFLPVIGLALGYLLGADPLTWLISGPLGWLMLVIGVGLTGIGVWWTSMIATRVERLL
jgi:tight adherence protein B